MMKFETGKTYAVSSICDHDCIYTATILKRTVATVTANIGGRGVKTFRIGKSYDGAECFKPLGSYSMAPTIRAA